MWLKWVQSQSFPGVLLLVATWMALWVSNTGLAEHYHDFLHAGIAVGSYYVSVHMVINELLMSFFFLMVGLEIKAEYTDGELNSREKILFPASAALGGAIFPALIYGLCCWSWPSLWHGWAIPMATDIAFSLAVFSLLAPGLPSGLKVFLTALAIIDDLIAILVIALFYPAKHDQQLIFLIPAAVALLLMWWTSYQQKQQLLPHVALTIVLWFSFLNIGLHPTLAAVIMAITLADKNMVHRLHQLLEPWVLYLILPLFAFANTGINFQAITLSLPLGESDVVMLAIMAGLVIGKPLGIITTAYCAVRYQCCQLPQQCSWAGILGVACLCGIGFTMSLFIGDLAFLHQGDEMMGQVRLGILLASLLSASIGYAILYRLRKD